MNSAEEKSSGFIGKDTAELDNSFSEVKPFHASEESYSQLYTVRRHGKLYILKGLKSVYMDDPLYQQLLRKEYEIGYFLDHPNICKIMGWEESEQYGPCILMEYIDGEDLNAFLNKHTISLPVIKKVLTEICQALDYIHSKQIIHRDLKPENVLITFMGQNVKLIDFGFSDSSDFQILKKPAGTRFYMAPEQKNGEFIDGRADIFSLGKIMEDILKVYPNHALQKVAARCTREDKKDRYRSATELSKRIQSISDSKLKWYSLILLFILLVIGGYFLLRPKVMDKTNLAPSQQNVDDVPAAIITEDELQKHLK